jgi:hypothetical protein
VSPTSLIDHHFEPHDFGTNPTAMLNDDHQHGISGHLGQIHTETHHGMYQHHQNSDSNSLDADNNLKDIINPNELIVNNHSHIECGDKLQTSYSYNSNNLDLIDNNFQHPGEVNASGAGCVEQDRYGIVNSSTGSSLASSASSSSAYHLGPENFHLIIRDDDADDDEEDNDCSVSNSINSVDKFDKIRQEGIFNCSRFGTEESHESMAITSSIVNGSNGYINPSSFLS